MGEISRVADFIPKRLLSKGPRAPTEAELVKLLNEYLPGFELEPKDLENVRTLLMLEHVIAGLAVCAGCNDPTQCQCGGMKLRPERHPRSMKLVSGLLRCADWISAHRKPDVDETEIENKRHWQDD